jgi:hypothetical protein
MSDKAIRIIIVALVCSISVFLLWFLDTRQKTTKDEDFTNEPSLVQDFVLEENTEELEESEYEINSGEQNITEDEVTDKTSQSTNLIVDKTEPVAEPQIEDVQNTKVESSIVYNVQNVLNMWRPYVVRVTCIILDEHGNKKSFSDGSGFLSNDPKGALIITNKHVFSPHNNSVTDYCDVYFPESKETVRIEKKDRYTNSKGHDLGALVVTNPSNHVSHLLRNDSTTSRNCIAVKPDSDDDLVIIGYPKGSSKTDISYEQGKLSGYIGSYFISTAKVTEGYSGGIAVSLKNNCFLGITSAAYKEDLTKSLILDVNQF